jgi:hypothetical protein
MSEENSVPDHEHDFTGVLKSIINKVNFKLAIVMFIFGFILFSNFAFDKFIAKFSGAVDGDQLTTKGAIIQLVFYTLALIVFDLLIKLDVM